MYIYIYNVHCVCQSRLNSADYALIFSSFRYNSSLVTWTVVCLTAAKFKPLTFSVGLRFVQYSEHFHCHDLELLLLVACIVLSYSHIPMTSGKPYAFLEPVCAFEKCHWWGVPCFAGAAGICRKFPGGTGISHHRSDESFVKDQFNDSA
jgi:hypothetical protein